MFKLAFKFAQHFSIKKYRDKKYQSSLLESQDDTARLVKQKDHFFN